MLAAVCFFINNLKNLVRSYIFTTFAVMAYRLSIKAADSRLVRWATQGESVALIVVDGEGEESLELFRADTLEAMLRTYISAGDTQSDLWSLLTRCIHDGDPESWADDVRAVFEHRLLLCDDKLADHSPLLTAYREGMEWHVTFRGREVAVVERDMPLPPPIKPAPVVREQPPVVVEQRPVSAPPTVNIPPVRSEQPPRTVAPPVMEPEKSGNSGCLRAFRMLIGLLIGVAIGLGAIYLVNHYLLNH